MVGGGENSDYLGGNMGILLDKIRRKMGTHEILLDTMKDQSIQQQLLDVLQNGMMTSQESQVISKSYSPNEPLSTTYVLASYYWPMDKYTSSENATNSEHFAEECEEIISIVGAGISNSKDKWIDSFEDSMGTGANEMDNQEDSVNDIASSSLLNNTIICRNGCEAVNSCNSGGKTDDNVASPHENANGSSQNALFDKHSPSSGSTCSEISEESEYVASLRDPREREDPEEEDNSDYYNPFDPKLVDILQANDSPIFSPQNSCYLNQSVETDKLHLPVSPYSFVSDSSQGSETDSLLADLFNLIGDDKKNAKVKNADAGPTNRNRSKVEVSDAPLTVISKVKDHLACPFNGSYTDLLANCNENPVFERDCDGDLPLHMAVVHQNDALVKQLVKLMNGRELDAINRDQQTPLHLALYLENNAIIQYLLQNGADPMKADHNGNNMMHLGCKVGSVQILELLVRNHRILSHKLEAMLSAHNYEGLSPLHEAVKMVIETDDHNARKRGRSVIEFLLHKLNCNLDIQELKGGRTVTMIAVEAEDWDLVDLFITCGANVNMPSHGELLALDLVAHTDNLELAKDLITRGARSGTKNDFSNAEMKALFDSNKRKRRRQGGRKPKRVKSDGGILL